MVNILIYLRKLYHKGIHGNISVCGKKLKFISLLFQWVARSPSACRPCLLKWSSAWDRREPKHEGERSGSRLILPVGGQIDKFNSDLTEKGSWFLTLEEIKVIPLKLGKAVRIYQKCLESTGQKTTQVLMGHTLATNTVRIQKRGLLGTGVVLLTMTLGGGGSWESGTGPAWEKHLSQTAAMFMCLCTQHNFYKGQVSLKTQHLKETTLDCWELSWLTVLTPKQRGEDIGDFQKNNWGRVSQWLVAMQ